MDSLKIFAVSSALLASASCKEVTPQGDVKYTSTGDELRTSFDFNKKNTTNGLITSQTTAVDVGTAKECPEKSFLYNGFCLELSRYYVWSHSETGADMVSLLSEDSCSGSSSVDGCQKLRGYRFSGTSFEAISKVPGNLTDILVPVFQATTSSGQQYLSSASLEVIRGVNDGVFEGESILFWVPAGSVGSNTKISRYSLSKNGPWKYLTRSPESRDLEFQVTFGSIF